MNVASNIAVNPDIGRTVDVNGIKTNVHDVGTGTPVLMIHGSGPGVSAWSNWRMSIPVLAQKRRVVAPDCVGFGYTERPADIRYDKEMWLNHLIGLLDALEIEKTDVIGNSFGGAMALGLAIRHPDRIGRIVLMGSVGIDFKLTDGLDAVWGYEHSVEGMRKVLDIFAYNNDLITDDLAKLRYQAADRSGIAEAFASMFPAPRQQWIKALAYPREEIASIKNKTLIVHGREDRVIPPENAQQFFTLIKDAEMHQFGRCGHWVQIEHKDRFNALVSEFLD
jgi:2-hydroxymuconate-semialdehyde hydrolase